MNILPKTTLLIAGFIAWCHTSLYAQYFDPEFLLQDPVLKGAPLISTEYEYVPGKEPVLIGIYSFRYRAVGAALHKSYYSSKDGRYLWDFGMNKHEDSLGRLVFQEFYDHTQLNPPLTYEVTYGYDQQNRQIEARGIDPNKRHDSFMVSSTYDTWSGVREDSWYINGRKQDHVRFAFDKAGRVISEEHRDSAYKMVRLIDRTYNDRGDLESVRKVAAGSKTEIRTYRYQYYDKAGNWLWQTEYDEAGKPIRMIQRLIEY